MWNGLVSSSNIWTVHKQEEFVMDFYTLWTYIRGFLRISFVILNNLYCIPTHCLWLITIWPLRWISPRTFYYFEGFGFQWLLAMVSAWSYTAGYDIIEMGDEIKDKIKDKALIMVNHQSTSDVPLIMAALDGHEDGNRNIMWIMDRMFKKTNFGLVSWFHRDFFISSGKDRREKSLTELTAHLHDVYIPFRRTWILLFPEGGFLRKRREVSRQFALKNNLPTLNHVTVPRVGAVQNIVAVTSSVNRSNGHVHSVHVKNSEDHLKWLVDLTIAYPNGKPLDILTILSGVAPPCSTVFHFRCYPISEVPTDAEQLKQWVYDRYIEKESLLETYYKTGRFPDHRAPGEFCQPRRVQHDGFRMLILHLLYITSTLFHWKILTFLYSCVF